MKVKCLTAFLFAGMALGISVISAQEEIPNVSSLENTRIAYIRNSDVHMIVYPDDSSATKLISIMPGPSKHPTWSPDGTQLAFDAVIAASPSSSRITLDIFKLNLATQEVVQLTEALSDELFPVWSPSGDHIVFVSNRDGNWEIYLMDSDGSNQVRLTNHDAVDGLNGLTWSPDSSQIAFISNRDEGRETLTEDYEAENIYLLNVDKTLRGDSNNVVSLTKANKMCPTGEFYYNLSWSENDQLAFASSCGAEWDIYTFNVSQALETQNDLILTNLTQSPMRDGILGLDWSPDNSKIVFVANPDVESPNDLELFVIDVVVPTVENGEPQITQLTHNPRIRTHYAFPAWTTAE